MNNSLDEFTDKLFELVNNNKIGLKAFVEQYFKVCEEMGEARGCAQAMRDAFAPKVRFPWEVVKIK